MNLCSGTLEEDAGRAVVRIARQGEDPVKLSIGRFVAVFVPYKSSPVLLGIRPEAVTLADGGAQDGVSFSARINVVEPTGADNLAFFNLGEREAVARLPPGKARAGDCVRLQIDPVRALIFDPRTQRLVG